MKRLTSIFLAVLMVISSVACLFTVSAVAEGVELFKDGDFESATINNSLGKLDTPQNVEVSEFNTNRDNYIGKWYRASGGNTVTDTDSDNADWVSGGEETFPTYFAPNSKQVADPLNADNKVLRSVQNLQQYLDITKVAPNSTYTLKFKYISRCLDGENMVLGLSFVSPRVNDETKKLLSLFDIVLPITDVEVVSIPDGVTAVASEGKIIIKPGNAPSDKWQEIELNFTVGDLTESSSALDPSAIAFNFLNDVVLDANNSSRSTRAIYYDDISLKKLSAVDVIGNAEFYNDDGKIENSNDYAKATTTVGGKETVVINEGDLVTATANYNKDSGAYEFVGWYKDGDLVTTDPSVTFTAKAGEVYIPRIKSNNILSDSASFESYADETALKYTGTDYPSGAYWGGNKNAGYLGATKAETIYTAKGETIEQVAAGTVSGNSVNVKISDAYAYTGNKSLRIVNSYWSASLGIDVKPNTDYILSYYILAPKSTVGTQNTIRDSAIMTTLNVGEASSVSGANKAINNSFGTFALDHQIITDKHDGENWVKVTHTFNSMNLTKVYLLLGQTAYGGGAASWAHIDELTCAETVAAEMTVDMKSCASIEPVGASLDGLVAGQLFEFKVIHAEKADPTVKLNGNQIFPNADGLYTCNVSEKNTLSVRFEGDEDLNDYDKDYDGNDLSKYNEDLYLTNIWEGNVVYHEPALFVPGRETVKLLYPVDKVVSLRSYSLEINYVEGVDYEVTDDGLIKILEGSRIPVYEGALTTTTKPDSNVYPLKENANEFLCFIGDTTYPQYAIAVTYEHSTTFEDGYTPAAPVSQNKKLANTLAKLEAGEKVNIVLFGDSISTGRSSSGQNYPTGIYDATNTEGNFYPNLVINVAPYAPTFIDMLISRWEQQYPGQVNLKNLSLGGKTADWGMKNIAKRLELWIDEDGNQVTPDLIMVGFGVNDSGVATETYKANMKAIVDNAREASGNADMEALYYSPMLPNQRATTWDATILLDYEKALNELAAEDDKIGVLNLTSIFAEIVKSKEAIDYLNTNVNHGNDFAARLYATGILAALGESPKADAPTLLTKTYNSVTLKAVDGYEYSMDGEKWQTSNTFSGLEAETEYTFYQRFAETANTYAGDASEAAKIVTNAVPPFTPGNVNGDAKNDVNLDDVVALAQVVAGWQDVVHDEAALDINGDGSVDLDDVVTLAQYVAGWDGIKLSDKAYIPDAEQ